MEFLQHIQDLLARGSNFKGRHRLLKSLVHFRPKSRSIYGPLLTTRSDDYTNNASVFGYYGHELADLIKGMPTDGIFIDFGCNTGVYSLLASQQLTQGKVFSFEPNTEVFADFLQNIKLNGARNILPMNFGIALRSEIVPFVYQKDHSGLGHVADNTTMEASEHIVLIAVDDFSSLINIENGQHVICKIDTEGSEYTILRSLENSEVLPRITLFYVEIDEQNLARQNSNTEQIYEILHQNGFKETTNRRGQAHYDEIFVPRG